MCDSTADLVSDLKSDLQQIRQQREKILNEQNNFFNRFYADHFTFQQDAYQINISDSEEEEEPTRIRIMTMRTQTIFEKKPKKKKEKPPPDENIQLPPPIVVKPICIDRASQSKKVELRTLETQTSIRSTYKDAETIATSNAEVQTHSIRLRCEATNTDSVLPSYENVCIAFLESLLEDAPVFINNGPKPEQLEGILMDFLNQLIRDAKDFDNQQIDASNQNGQPILSNGALIKRAKLVDANIQQEVPVQTIATQSPVSLKVLESPSVIINYMPPPEEPHDFVGNFVTNPTCLDIPPTNKFRMIQMRRGDQFTFPPSLRVEPEKPPVKMVKTNYSIWTSPHEVQRKQVETETDEPPKKITDQPEAKKPHKNMFQIDVLENQNVSVTPVQNTGVIPSVPSYLPPPLQPQPSQPETQLPNQQPKKQQKQLPKLHDLVIHPLEDIEDLSEFNIESYLKDLNSSSDNDDIEDSTKYGHSAEYNSYGDTSLSESTIEKALNSSTVSVGASVSEDPLSDGELRDFDFGDSTESYESDTKQWSYKH